VKAICGVNESSDRLLNVKEIPSPEINDDYKPWVIDDWVTRTTTHLISD